MKLLISLMILMTSFSALAQNHMFGFNADGLLLGQYAFSESKDSGEKKDDNQSGFLSINFARSVTRHIQAGLEASYARTSDSDGTGENYRALLGGIYNFTEDLFTNSGYVSLYAGMEWGHQYLDDQRNKHDENLVTKVALGKRFPVAFISENFTYSPEVVFKTTNATVSSDTEWKQELIFRFLQFSVFF